MNAQCPGAGCQFHWAVAVVLLVLVLLLLLVGKQCDLNPRLLIVVCDF